MNYKRSFLILVLAVTLTCLSVVGARQALQRDQATTSDAKDQHIAQTLAATTLEFPLYYPTKLPAKYSIDSTSITYDKGVALYQIHYGDNGTIAVANQAKPADVLFDDFYNRLLKNKADVFNAHGKAVIGTADSKTIGSLVTDKTWVLLTASGSIDKLEMTQLVASLEPAL